MKKILFSLVLFAGLVLFAPSADAASCTNSKQVNGYNVQVTIRNTPCSVITQTDWNWLWGSEAPSIIAILGGTGTYTKYGSCGNIHDYVVTNIPVNGKCGSANGVATSSAPVKNLCSAGNKTAVTSGTTTWTWKCIGLYGGSNANCSAPKISSGVDGVCGSANGTTVSSAPTTNLCSVGTASTVTGSGPWSWTCTGTGGGTIASCAALKSGSSGGDDGDGSGGVVNGQCVVGGQYVSIPTNPYLCLRGTASPSPVNGGVNGPWTWSCLGSGTGHTDALNCSATKIVSGIDSRFNCSNLSMTNPAVSPVNVNNTTTWTVTPLSSCPTCSKVWSVVDNNGTTTTTNSSNTLDQIFTTIGLKIVSVQFSSTSLGVMGLPCTATTTIVQQGGSIREI
jgi:hypothetical protein